MRNDGFQGVKSGIAGGFIIDVGRGGSDLTSGCIDLRKAKIVQENENIG